MVLAYALGYPGIYMDKFGARVPRALYLTEDTLTYGTGMCVGTERRRGGRGFL